MKTPPLLLGAVLLFWGWQSDLLMMGAVMSVILEGARLVSARWEFSEADFRRTATFCTLLSLTLAIYAFTSSEEGGNIEGLLHGPGAARNATITTIHTATSWLRWLPIILFLFVTAQIYSTREAVPLTIFSTFLSWRVRREKKSGRNFAVPNINVTYPYFIICLFSSSIHPGNGTNSFFWGECILIGWALWPFRSMRFGIVIWVLALVMAMAASYWGQYGIGLLQQDVERYNMRWMMRFMRSSTDPREAYTAIGQIGALELSDSIVIRLKTQNNELPPSYLREATYRIYESRSRVWLAGGQRNNFDPVIAQTNQVTWVLLQGKSVPFSANIACYLNDRSTDGNPEGLLPLPSGIGELDDFDAYLLQKNPLGDVKAEGPGLVIFNALYGPGATIDSPPDTNRDCYVPSNEVPALKQVIAEMNLSGQDEQKTLNAVAGFFQRKFTYSIWQGPDKLATTNQTPVARFLLHSRSGHCEYFATATVLLLRELKIPARYAVGYFVNEASHGGYVVRERDAHAWCLVWNDKQKIWQNFDTTPASWTAIEGRRMSRLQGFWDFWSWVRFQIAKFRWGQGNVRDYILWGLIPVLAALMAQIIFSRRKKQNKPARKEQSAVFWPGLDSEFYALERKLAQRGVPRPPNEPLSDWLARALENPALYDLREPLTELLRLHYRYRFDPRGLNDKERELMTRKARACLDALSRAENAGAKV
jgi:protein-glutamine gamma-glutamyltransferase